MKRIETAAAASPVPEKSGPPTQPEAATGRPARPHVKTTVPRQAESVNAGNVELRKAHESLQSHVLNLERQLAERTRELEDARLKAEQIKNARNLLLAGVSHEVRTPMNGVLSMADALLATSLDDTQRTYVDILHNSGEVLLRVINDIVDLAKVEAGRTDLEMECFDIRTLVKDVNALYGGLARDKGLTLTFSLGPGSAGIYQGDPVRLRQVLGNLISNAVKFTQTGGVAVLVEKLEGGDPFEVRLSCSVRDTGIGVAPDDMDRIFEPFTRASSSSQRIDGAGLGLAICRRMCELMGGGIRAESTFGEGSCFTFEFVVRQACKGEVPSCTALRATEATETLAIDDDLRILLVDDHPVNQIVLQTILSPLGLSTTVVENGELAVAACAKSDFDLIFMDIEMPVMNGADAARAIRDRERQLGLARTPIFALTANAMSHQALEYINLGMDGHIAKPIRAPAVLDALASVSRKRLRATLS